MWSARRCSANSRPVSQRGAVIAIYGAIYTLAGIVAPSVMGSVIQQSGGLLEGYMTGFTINAVVMIAVRIARPVVALAQYRARPADGGRKRRRRNSRRREGDCRSPDAIRGLGAANPDCAALHPGYARAPRTNRPGRAPVAVAMALRHRAGDDGGVVAVDLLQQAPAADRKVVMHLRRMQMQPVIVDDIEVGLVARRDDAAIVQADRQRGLARLRRDHEGDR